MSNTFLGCALRTPLSLRQQHSPRLVKTLRTLYALGQARLLLPEHATNQLSRVCKARLASTSSSMRF